LKPQAYQFELIETLLPDATRHVEDNKKSRCLYLWAPEDAQRQGWTMIVDDLTWTRPVGQQGN